MKLVVETSSLRLAFLKLCEYFLDLECKYAFDWERIEQVLKDDFRGRFEYRESPNIFRIDTIGKSLPINELWMEFESDVYESLFILTWAS